MADRAVKILEMKQVDAQYSQVPALLDVSLHVKEGEIVSLIGSNGAGKTSTLNAIYGILPIAEGNIFYQNKTIRDASPQELVHLGICYVPEGGQVFAPMSVLDNLIMGGYSRRGKGKKQEKQENLATVFRLFPVLETSKKRRAGTLSGGERQMLTLARALMSSPKLLLLDEPSLGLAPMLITEVMHLIAEMRDAGLCVLLVEQNARAALKISDRGYVMEGGRINMEGPAEQLISDKRVKAAYLGHKSKQ
ncbi:ABC transporter ATP-binding protein [Thermodesulfobacteriota bacterium]